MKWYVAHILVHYDGTSIWYSVEVRAVLGIFAGRWKQLKPDMQPTLYDARELIFNYVGAYYVEIL